MRRHLLAALTFTAVLLAGTACGGDSEEPASPGTTAPTTSAASPTGAAAGNTKEVCDNVKRINSDNAAKVTTAVTNAAAQAAKGDTAAAQKSIDEANTLTRDWASKLQAEAGKADNAELKQALTDLAGKVQKLESQNATLDDLKSVVNDANTTVQKYCG